MSPPDSFHVFLSLRSLHILAAALWLGATSFVSLFLLPALGRRAPETIAQIARGKFHLFMSMVGGTTVLSGLFLYWYLFGAGAGDSHAAWVFGIAGTFGLTAAFIGRGVLGKSAARIAELFEQASKEAGHTKDGVTSEAIAMLQQRMSIAGRVVLALMVATLLLMSLGHYL